MVASKLLEDPKFQSWKKQYFYAKACADRFLIVSGGRKQAKRFVYLAFATQERRQDAIDQFESFVIDKDPKEIREEEPRARDLRPPEFF